MRTDESKGQDTCGADFAVDVYSSHDPKMENSTTLCFRRSALDNVANEMLHDRGRGNLVTFLGKNDWERKLEVKRRRCALRYVPLHILLPVPEPLHFFPSTLDSTPANSLDIVESAKNDEIRIGRRRKGKAETQVGPSPCNVF